MLICLINETFELDDIFQVMSVAEVISNQSTLQILKYLIIIAQDDYNCQFPSAINLKIMEQQIVLNLFFLKFLLLLLYFSILRLWKLLW